MNLVNLKKIRLVKYPVHNTVISVFERRSGGKHIYGLP